jgi:hypothetical protein
MLRGSNRPALGSRVLIKPCVIHLNTQLGSRMPWDAGAVAVAALHGGASPACGARAVLVLGLERKRAMELAQGQANLCRGCAGLGCTAETQAHGIPILRVLYSYKL